jgi:AraC-like DNA-binding protein
MFWISVSSSRHPILPQPVQGTDMQPELPVISAKIFEGFEDFLATKGVGLAGLLTASGIDDAILKNLDCDLPLNQVCALFEHAAQETQDPCLGLHWGEAYKPGATGVYGYSMLSAGTLREAMQANARYASLVLHPARVSFEETQDYGVLIWQLSSFAKSSSAQFVGFSSTTTMLRLRAIAGPSWLPLAVDLPSRELPCRETVQRIFGTQVSFNAPRIALYADTKSLDLKAKNRDPQLFELIELLGNRLLAERASPGDIVAQCQKVIVDQLSQGEVTLEAAATVLELAPRTLQSKLTASGTTFDSLLQETRKNLAMGYLRESDLTMTDIALMLGFSELSVFSRATQRWFGMPPSAYRQQLRSKGIKAG